MEAVIFPKTIGYVEVSQNGTSLPCRCIPIKGGYKLFCEGEGEVTVSYKGGCCGRRKSVTCVIDNNLVCKPE